MQQRRVSARVRRRRTLAVALLAVLTIVAIVLTTSGSSSHRAKTRATSVVQPTRARPITHIAAEEAPWLLPAPVSRATAVVDGTSVLVMGGIGTNQSSSTGVYRLDPTAVR